MKSDYYYLNFIKYQQTDESRIQYFTKNANSSYVFIIIKENNHYITAKIYSRDSTDYEDYICNYNECDFDHYIDFIYALDEEFLELMFDKFDKNVIKILNEIHNLDRSVQELIADIINDEDPHTHL